MLYSAAGVTLPSQQGAPPITTQRPIRSASSGSRSSASAILVSGPSVISVRPGSACERRAAGHSRHSQDNRRFVLTYHGCSLLPGTTHYLLTAAHRRAFLAPLAGYLRFSLVEFGGRADSVTRVASALAPGHNASSV